MYYNDEQLHKKIENLPEEVQDFIRSLDIADIISNIGLEQDSLISEIGDIYEETAKVITGETRPERFIDAIREKLGDENKDKAVQVGTEINNRILIPIRDAYKKISMGNLAPNPSSEVEPPTSYQLPQVVEQSSLRGRPATSYSDRDFIMNEIENPTPAGVSTMPYGQSPAEQLREVRPLATQEIPPPPNLPIENRQKMEVPVIRTMPRDVAMETNPSSASTSYQLPATSYPRGKFGHGTPPTIGQRVTSQTLEIPRQNSSSSSEVQPSQVKVKPPEPPNSSQLTATPKERVLPTGQASYPAPSFIPSQPGTIGGTLRGNPSPIPKPPTYNQQQTTNYQPSENKKVISSAPSADFPKPPEPLREVRPLAIKTLIPPTQKTEQVDDMVEDKLTKTVGVPSERRSYVVDPYREPLE